MDKVLGMSPVTQRTTLRSIASRWRVGTSMCRSVLWVRRKPERLVVGSLMAE